jgi:hypothetical protein
MRDNQDIFAALQLHDNGFQADHDVAIRLAAEIAVVVLVLVALRKVFGVFLFDLGVREAVADARVQLVEGFPFELLKGEKSCGLYRALERRGPYGEPATVADRFRYQTRQGMRVGFSPLRDVGIATDLA